VRPHDSAWRLVDRESLAEKVAQEVSTIVGSLTPIYSKAKREGAKGVSWVMGMLTWRLLIEMSDLSRETERVSAEAA